MRTIRRFRRHYKVLQLEAEDLSRKGVPKVLILIGAIFAAAMMVIGLTINLPAVTVAGLLLAGLTVTVFPALSSPGRSEHRTLGRSSPQS